MKNTFYFSSSPSHEGKKRSSQRKGYELDRLMYRVKKDEPFRMEFFSDIERAITDFDLTEDEKSALKTRDYARLFELGMKDELIVSLARFSRLAQRSS